jgi:hypothetical protein
MSSLNCLNCFNCKLIYPKYFNINKKTYCYFCKLIYFLEQSDIFSINIGYSILNQDEIVKKTKEILIKENRIPSHKEIDPNSKLVLVNPFILKNTIKLMSQNEQICFSNVKVFFTENMDTESVRIRRLIDKPTSLKKSYEVFTKIQILPHQKVLYDKYHKSYVNANLNVRN